MTDAPSVVTLTLDATTRDIALARTVAAAMAARADLTLDQLEDARLAVDEAASELIAACVPGDRLVVEFAVDAKDLSVRMSAPRPGNEVIKQDTFTWTVLSALSDELVANVTGGVATIDLRIHRPVPAQA